MDNFPAHKVDSFSNIEIMFLPSNITSSIQPSDQVIFSVIKREYKKLFIIHLLNFNINASNNELKKINKKDSILLLYSALNKVKKETFKNCFKVFLMKPIGGILIYIKFK